MSSARLAWPMCHWVGIRAVGVVALQRINSDNRKTISIDEQFQIKLEKQTENGNHDKLLT
jgi:hypothetical protein